MSPGEPSFSEGVAASKGGEGVTTHFCALILLLLVSITKISRSYESNRGVMIDVLRVRSKGKYY